MASAPALEPRRRPRDHPERALRRGTARWRHHRRRARASALPPRAGRTKPAGGADGDRQFVHDVELGAFGRAHDHLGNAVPAGNHKRLFAQVDQQNAYRAAIVGVDRPRRVETRDAVFYRKTAPWAYLCFVAVWERHAKAGGHELARSWLERQRSIERSVEITTGAALGHVRGHRQAPALRQYFDIDSDARGHSVFASNCASSS